jgi:hypothetical protein
VVGLSTADGPPRGGYVLPAHTPHLSTWTRLTLDTTAILRDAGDLLTGFFGAKDSATRPSCPNESKAKSSGVKVASDSGGLAKWCVGLTGGGHTVLRIANNRHYAMETDYPPTWTMRRLGDPAALASRIVTATSRALTATPRGRATVIIPGAQTVEFTVPDGSVGEADPRPSTAGYLVDGSPTAYPRSR